LGERDDEGYGSPERYDEVRGEGATRVDDGGTVELEEDLRSGASLFLFF
jgi:hypothetical protein